MRTPALLLLTAALAACASSAPPPPPLAAAPSLAGTTWVAAEINGAPALANPKATLEFSQNGQAAGDGGCNRFSGPFTQTTKHLRFGQLIATQRACDDPVISGQETRYLMALNHTEDVGMSDERLVLRGDSGQLTFVRNEPGATTSDAILFRCASGEEITVVFGNGTARVTFEGGTDVLNQVQSGSGFAYESSRNSLRGKGDEVTWNRARMAPKICKKA